jgi:WD40 repeat protein
MPKTHIAHLPPNCGADLFGLNSNRTILVTRGTSGEEIMFSGLKDDEIIPFFVLKSIYWIICFCWHPTNPMIFFTGGGTMITVHQIQKDYQDGDAEENTSVVLGELDIGEPFDSIRLNQKGDLLLVLIKDKTCALLFRLYYEDGGIKFFRLKNQIIVGDEPIISADFLGNDIIGFTCNDEEGSVNIQKICPKSGKLKNEVFSDDDLAICKSFKFSPDGGSFVVLSLDALTLYSFSKESFELTFIQSIPLGNKYVGVDFQWHPMLPLLIVLSSKNHVNVVDFYKVGKDGFTKIHQVCVLENIQPKFFISGFNVTFGYYSSDETYMRLTIDFEDLARFPVEQMLTIRKVLTTNLQIDDLVEDFLKRFYNHHLSFERYAHLM